MSPIPPEHDNGNYGNLSNVSTSVEGKLLPLEENSVQIDGFVYDAARLAEIHPGGDLFVKVINYLTSSRTS